MKTLKLQRLYKGYRRKYFEESLRHVPSTWVRFSKEPDKKDMFGFCNPHIGIRVANSIRHWNRMVKKVLLHEMAHLSTWKGCRCKDVHGRCFDREMLRLARAGAFHHIW